MQYSRSAQDCAGGAEPERQYRLDATAFEADGVCDTDRHASDLPLYARDIAIAVRPLDESDA